MCMKKIGFLLDLRVEFISKLPKTMINFLYILQKQEKQQEMQNGGKKEQNDGKRAETSRSLKPRDQIAPEADFKRSRGKIDAE